MVGVVLNSKALGNKKKTKREKRRTEQHLNSVNNPDDATPEFSD